MQCTNCGATNSTGAHYCGDCGQIIESPANENLSHRQGERTGEGRPDSIAFAPRNLTGLLAESARVYRKNLRVFLGIGLISQIPGLLSLGSIPPWWEITLIITSFGLTALTYGAITHAVAIDYFGLTPTVGSSYSRARQRVVTLVVCLFIHLVLLAISLFLSLVLVGIPMLLVLLVVLWFYPQAIMLENLGPVEAFRRSIFLVQRNWLRVFGTIVACWILPVALALAVLFLSNDSAISRISLAIIGTVTAPWTMIGSTLMYFDLRVRKEGYSADILESELGRSGLP